LIERQKDERKSIAGDTQGFSIQSGKKRAGASSLAHSENLRSKTTIPIITMDIVIIGGMKGRGHCQELSHFEKNSINRTNGKRKEDLINQASKKGGSNFYQVAGIDSGSEEKSTTPQRAERLAITQTTT